MNRRVDQRLQCRLLGILIPLALVAGQVVELHVSPSCDAGLPSPCFDTIQGAVDHDSGRDERGRQILVHAGTYRNINWRDIPSPRTAFLSNKAAVTISYKRNLTIRAADSSARPRVEFDGSGAFVITHSTHLTIEGFEIVGPAGRISGAEASQDRLRLTGLTVEGQVGDCGAMQCPSCAEAECRGLTNKCVWDDMDGCAAKAYAYFSGSGLTVWRGSTHITFRDNVVHHCSGSGIRVNKGDNIVIEDNVVFDNTWWTSTAPSAVVLAESLGSGNNTIRRNKVFGNRNYMPFYSPDLHSLAHSGVDSNPEYAAWNQDYIIDGSGVYITRNYDYTGTTYLQDNVAYDNGINGVVVHKTHNVVVTGNVMFGNGRVSKDIEGRQNAGGFVINNSENVTIGGNYVSILGVDGDLAYQCFATCVFEDVGGNVACPLSASVHAKYTGVALTQDCGVGVHRGDYVSTAPSVPQYTYLYYPCNESADGDECSACDPGGSESRGCTESPDAKVCQGVFCRPPPPECVVCGDVPSSYMVKKGKSCDSYDYGWAALCNASAAWTADRTCELTCALHGVGYGSDCCPPTEASSQTPTTVAPTKELRSTTAPSAKPTQSPSATPTTAPSVSLSLTPSAVPTRAPNGLPSMAPAVSPSASPSEGMFGAPSFPATTQRPSMLTDTPTGGSMDTHSSSAPSTGTPSFGVETTPSPVACTPCTNEPSDEMLRNGKTCDNWVWGLVKNCRANAHWRVAGVCTASCDAVNLGYGDVGERCCPVSEGTSVSNETLQPTAAPTAGGNLKGKRDGASTSRGEVENSGGGGGKDDDDPATFSAQVLAIVALAAVGASLMVAMVAYLVVRRMRNRRKSSNLKGPVVKDDAPALELNPMHAKTSRSS